MSVASPSFHTHTEPSIPQRHATPVDTRNVAHLQTCHTDGYQADCLVNLSLMDWPLVPALCRRYERFSGFDLTSMVTSDGKKVADI